MKLPRWLVFIGAGGNLVAGVSFLIQGNALWLLFAAAIAVNILTLMVGGRTTDPPPKPPTEPKPVLNARLHDEWDAEYRKLLPPEPQVVWRRSIPEYVRSNKPRKITDFNN